MRDSGGDADQACHDDRGRGREGKTSLGLQISLTAARAGVVVMCLMVDEGDEPACVRIGQQLGYIREQIEERTGDILEQI